MTSLEFRICLVKLGMNYTQIGRELRVSPATASTWGRGESKIPYTAELVIYSMLAERGFYNASTVEEERVESA